MAWAADLDRGQHEPEAQLNKLGQRQRRRSSSTTPACEPTPSASPLRAMSSKALLQLRSEFERLITQFVEEGRAGGGARRRAPPRPPRGQRAAARPRTRPARAARPGGGRVLRTRGRWLVEAERRQLAQLEKTLDRAASRLSEDAERRFDAQIKVSREKSAERLSRSWRSRSRTSCARPRRRCPTGSSSWARATADRMERRLRDGARAAEAQGEVASERLRHVSERLDAALAAAEQRIAAYEESSTSASTRSSATSSGPSVRSSATSRFLAPIETNSSRQETSPRERTDAAMDQLTLLDERDQDELGKVESWRLHVLISRLPPPARRAPGLEPRRSPPRCRARRQPRLRARDRRRDPALGTRFEVMPRRRRAMAVSRQGRRERSANELRGD